MDATPSRLAPDTPAGRTPTLDGFARFVCRQLKAPLAAVSFLQGAAHDLVGLASVEALKGDPARPRALEAAPPPPS